MDLTHWGCSRREDRQASKHIKRSISDNVTKEVKQGDIIDTLWLLYTMRSTYNKTPVINESTKKDGIIIT